GERGGQGQAGGAGGLGRGDAGDGVLDDQAARWGEPEPAARLQEDVGGRLLPRNMRAVDDRVEGRGGQADLVEVPLDLDRVGAGGDGQGQAPAAAVRHEVEDARQGLQPALDQV